MDSTPPHDHHVVGAGDHALRGEVHGLLGRAALAVDGRGGHGLREARRQDGVPGGVHGLLGDLVDRAADDVVDLRGVDPGAADEGAQGVGEEFDGVDMSERPVRLALPDGRAYGFDDDCITHGAGLLGRMGRCPAPITSE